MPVYVKEKTKSNVRHPATPAPPDRWFAGRLLCQTRLYGEPFRTELFRIPCCYNLQYEFEHFLRRAKSCKNMQKCPVRTSRVARVREVARLLESFAQKIFLHTPRMLTSFMLRIVLQDIGAHLLLLLCGHREVWAGQWACTAAPRAHPRPARPYVLQEFRTATRLNQYSWRKGEYNHYMYCPENAP